MSADLDAEPSIIPCDLCVSGIIKCHSDLCPDISLDLAQDSNLDSLPAILVLSVLTINKLLESLVLANPIYVFIAKTQAQTQVYAQLTTETGIHN